MNSKSPVRKKRTDPSPVITINIVKYWPPVPRGLTSLKPTVVMVMMVM